jgi:hypothetical protein
MRARRLVMLAVASALIVALTVPVAAQAASVNTTMSGTFDTNTGDGTFSVDSGPLQGVCTGGTTHDEGKVIKNTRQGLKIVVLKSFACDEGPTFVLQLSVLLDFDPSFSDTFSWNVMAAGDGLEGLRGAGTGYGDDLGDHYAGRLTLP